MVAPNSVHHGIGLHVRPTWYLSYYAHIWVVYHFLDGILIRLAYMHMGLIWFIFYEGYIWFYI